MTRNIPPLLHCWASLVAGLLLWTNTHGTEYPQSLNFINVLHNQNVAVGEVEAIIQDYQGFMWFGGRDGLLRYDGYEYVPALVEQKSGDAASREKVIQVVDLLEDSRGDMWAATRGGLLKYDRDRDLFMRLQQQNGQPLDIYSATANRLAEAPTGELLAGAYQGLHIIDPQTLNATILGHDPANKSSLANNVIRDLIVAADGDIWLGTDAGISHLDWQTKTFTNYVPHPAQPQSVPDNSVWALAQDGSGQIWAGVRHGLYRFDPATTQFVRYRENASDPFSLAGDFIYDLYVDREQRLWVGSDSGGISLYVPESDRFIRHQSDGNRGTLATNSIRRIFQDRTGDFWIGNYPTGISYHNQETAAFAVYRQKAGSPQSLMADNVGAVAEDGNGNLWVGAAGVTRIDAQTGEFKHYGQGNGGSKINSTSIISSLVDSEGDIWFGTWAGGLQRYNPTTDRFDTVPFDETLAKTGVKTSTKLNDNVVWHIYEDRRNNLWLATHNGGLSRYDKQSGSFTIYEQDLANPDTSIGNQLVWATLEDSKGRFWVGTASSLDLMDRDTGTFKHYRASTQPPNGLVTDSIGVIFEDSQQQVWFGADSGLYQYQEESDSFKLYSTKDGFASNGVRGITEDESGNLWLATNNGVVMFNPTTLEVNNYQTYNGETIGGFNLNAALTTQNGQVVLGGLNGLRLFDSRKLGANPNLPPIVLTDFQLFTKSVAINGPEKILSKAINRTDSITLDYTKSMLSFSFAALNFRDPQKNQYAYKLEGFDDDWRHVGNQRTALYTNLDAGNYTFRVKASNNDGVWNEAGISLNLRQLPPPWKTWWAYTIYTLLVIAALAQFVRAQRRKRQVVEEQNRILELRVAERTSELREKNKDIQAMLSNMSQGLFTIQADGTVHQEYSRQLESIFAMCNLAGQDALELLFGRAKLGADTLDQAREAVRSIIGEDEMNYDFNAHLLPSEYQAEIGEQLKFLALDWNPIVVDDTVQKLMVSVRDVTQLKQMENEARAKQRELDIISQLLNVPAKKYLAFSDGAKKFVAENRRFIKANCAKDAGVIALLFRNMHTIKGNARTYGFASISELAHKAEGVYSELKNNADSIWQPEVMLADLDALDAILHEYETVYFDVLGRRSNSDGKRDQLGFWADAAAVQTIRKTVRAVEEKMPALRDSRELAPITDLLDRALSAPLSTMLGDLVVSLPSLAEELGKPAPTVNIADGGVRIRKSMEEMLSNIFPHMLRNALDHGIESPELRATKGKSAAGNISIVAQPHSEHLEILVTDDGQGLNMERLYKRGVETGAWSAGEVPSAAQVGNLIFSSGISTKDQVTDISGRGVGMDAVRQFLNTAGGEISLRFLDTAGENLPADKRPAFIRFGLLITLPAEQFVREPVTEDALVQPKFA